MNKKLKSMTYRLNLGSGLVEVMVVLVITVLITMFALPIYHDYMTRTRVSETFQLFESAKQAVASFYSERSRFPRSIDEVPSGDVEGQYIESVTIKHTADGKGVILLLKLRLDDDLGEASDLSVGFWGKPAKGSLRWVCFGAKDQVNNPYQLVDLKFLPSTCENVPSIFEESNLLQAQVEMAEGELEAAILEASEQLYSEFATKANTEMAMKKISDALTILYETHLKGVSEAERIAYRLNNPPGYREAQQSIWGYDFQSDIDALTAFRATLKE